MLTCMKYAISLHHQRHSPQNDVLLVFTITEIATVSAGIITGGLILKILCMNLIQLQSKFVYPNIILSLVLVVTKYNLPAIFTIIPRLSQNFLFLTSQLVVISFLIVTPFNYIAFLDSFVYEKNLAVLKINMYKQIPNSLASSQ